MNDRDIDRIASLVFLITGQRYDRENVQLLIKALEIGRAAMEQEITRHVEEDDHPEPEPLEVAVVAEVAAPFWGKKR